MASHSGSPHNNNNPAVIPLFYSKTPSAPNCITPDIEVLPIDNFDRDSLGHEENDRRDEYIDKIISEKKIEKVVRKLLNSTAKQEAEASLVRQKVERNTLNWLEKITASLRPTIDKASLPQFNGGPDDDVKEFFLQFKRTATFNKWDNNEQLCAFPLCLNKSASIFYESLPNKIRQDLQLIQQAFQNEYEPPERIWIKKTQLYGLKEGEKGLEHFIASLEKLSQELKVSEETKRDLFIQGVNSNLKRKLLLSQPETYTQAVRIARVNNSVNADDDARIVETVIKTMTKLQNQSAKHNTVSFADSDTPPVAAYSATPANLANPENATREVARLKEEIRKLKVGLRRQNNSNFGQNQDYNPATVNQPTCFICNKTGHLARQCRQEYQDPRIPQSNNSQYLYRKNFTQQPQWRNNRNWTPRNFDNQSRNMGNKYVQPDSNNRNWRSINSNNPQQTYKDNYVKPRPQNNKWNNVQNTRTGTHESQRNDMSIRTLGVDSIAEHQENDFEYDDDMTFEYDDVEDYLWDDSYDFGYKSYTNNQIQTFDDSYPYETNTDYYYNTPERDHMSYYRLDYTPLNPSYEDENNCKRHEIENFCERITHELSNLRDQVRYLSQYIMEQKSFSQPKEEVNNKEYLSTINHEPQNMKNFTYEDPEVVQDEASVIIDPPDIESIIRVDQNDADEIITNCCPESLDNTSEAETEDFVTYQQFIPENNKEFNDLVNSNQKKEILEETIIPVRLVDLSQEPMFDQDTDQISKKKTVPQTTNLNIWGKVCNHWTRILIDTGAAITAISYDLYKMLKNAGNNVTLQKSDLPRVTSANGQTLSIKGMFTLEFEIEKHTYQFKTYVIKNLNYDVILGKDFLTEYNGIIDFKENKLSLEINDGPYQLEENIILEDKSKQQLLVDQTLIQIPNLYYKNQGHIDIFPMLKALDYLNESNDDLSSRTELEIKIQSENGNYNDGNEDQQGIIETPFNNDTLNPSTDEEYCTTIEEHRESGISNQMNLSSLKDLSTSSENQGTTQLKVDSNHDIKILKDVNVFPTKWRLYKDLEYTSEPVKKLHPLILKNITSDQLPHFPPNYMSVNRSIRFSEPYKESRSLTMTALLLQLLLFIPIFLLCEKTTDHKPIFNFNMTKPLINEHVNNVENKFKALFEIQTSYSSSILQFPIFLKIPSIRNYIITNSYQENIIFESPLSKQYSTTKIQRFMNDYNALSKVTKNESKDPQAIIFKTPTNVNGKARASIDKTQEYDQKLNKVELITNNIIILLFCSGFTKKVNEFQGK